MENKIFKVYKRRFWMLLLFATLSFFCTFLIPQYVSTAHVNGCYYGVSQNLVQWSMKMYYVVYVVLVIPTAYLMNRMNVKWILIWGSACNTAACILQFLTVKSSGFIYVLISSLFGSVSSLFVLGQTPYVIANWFPSDELSRAHTFGTVGHEIGITIGFLLPPLMVSNNCSDSEAIEYGKKSIAYLLTGANSILFILIVFTFQNAPKLPTNAAQFIKKERPTAKMFVKSILLLMKNTDYMLTFVISGLMGGAYYVFTTSTTDLLIRYFPHEELKIASMMTLFSITGMIGTTAGGTVLDYTHKFKETTIVYCFMSFLIYLLYSTLLSLKILWVMFLIVGIYGIFASGFWPIVIEYGIETTFPLSEVISSNMQLWSMKLFGFAITQLISFLLDTYGPLYSHIAMGVNLLVCSILTCFLTRNYRRYKSHQENQSQPPTIFCIKN